MRKKSYTPKWEAARTARAERRAADPRVSARREAHLRRTEADLALAQVKRAADDREARKAARVAKAGAKKLVSA